MPIERLYLDNKEVVLVGTAHISNKSIELVRKTIENENPDTIGVELCLQRFQQLKSGKKWDNLDIVSVIKQGKTYLFLVNFLLSAIQKKIGGKMGIKPGSEMVEATNIAKEKELPIALLDRNVTTTLKRTFALMGIKEKLKLFFAVIMSFFGGAKEELTAEKIEELKQRDVMTQLINELSQTAPAVKKVLVDERDAFIADRILKSSGKKIVAIVGAGHLEGIKKYLKNPIDVYEFSTLPKKKKYFSFLKYAILISVVVLVGYSFLNKGPEVGAQMILWWFLINGMLSALGVLIARGHILTVLAAFIAAPITSLTPTIAAGWVAGLVEAKLNTPKVKDFEDLQNLEGIGDLTKNSIIKILLVVTLANIGSTLGTIIALPYILSLLA